MNPLSISTHPHVDFPDLLREAVVRLGFPREQLGKLEQQATLVVRLQGLPEVLLSQLDDRLWIWSLLPELSDARLLAMASEVLTVLLAPVVDVEGGQLTLGRGDHGFELKGLVNLECLMQDEGLLPVFTGFQAHLDAICRVLDLKGA
ncbi:InvB/SpaK family type III secretion system chaperone [Burkholderia pyrrocinia]